jgi:hypothetical protein
MGLPWVRLDSNISTHPKVLSLIAQRDGYRAFTAYVCALGYAGAHATDGLIERPVLATIHATERHAQMLVDGGFWEYDPDGRGWIIRNWDTRQELSVITEGKRAAQSMSARKTNCVRWHGPECGCWKGDR